MKTYIKPTCKTYRLELEGIIAIDSTLQYGGRTSTYSISEGEASQRRKWGSIWNK